MRFRLLAPVIILVGGCLMAISPFVPYLLDDGTNPFIQARHNVNFHGHYGEFFPGIPGAIIAVLALVALFSARWPKWPGVYAVAAMVAVGESAAALLLAQGFNDEPIKYDTVMEALAVLAVGSGVVALGAMAAWVGRATSASSSPAASRV
jgi:hypothetical protein